MALNRQLTPERVKDLLEYNPDTGVLFWRVNRSTVKAGMRAGWLNKTTGYILVHIDGRAYQAHRIIWTIVYGRWPQEQIDHINRDRADNRLANLRGASIAENAQNKSLYKNNASGYSGIGWHKQTQKWHVRLYISGKTKSLGLFKTLEDAISTREIAKTRIHPFKNWRTS